MGFSVLGKLSRDNLPHSQVNFLSLQYSLLGICLCPQKSGPGFCHRFAIKAAFYWSPHLYRIL